MQFTQDSGALEVIERVGKEKGFEKEDEDGGGESIGLEFELEQFGDEVVGVDGGC